MNREAYQGWEEDRSRGSGEPSPGGESLHPPSRSRVHVLSRRERRVRVRVIGGTGGSARSALSWVRAALATFLLTESCSVRDGALLFRGGTERDSNSRSAAVSMA